MLSENEYNGILLDIGIKIGYYRRKAGMTQAELAESTGLTLSYISQLESPNLHTVPLSKRFLLLLKHWELRHIRYLILMIRFGYKKPSRCLP